MNLLTVTMNKRLIYSAIMTCIVTLLAVNAYCGNSPSPGTPGGSGNSGGGNKYPNVEPLMCDIQARWHYQYKTGYRFCYPYIEWGCTPCGITIPPFPADDVIDESDPVEFVKWVRIIVKKFYEAKHLNCVDGNVYVAYNMSRSFSNEYEGEEGEPGNYIPKGTENCKIPDNHDYQNEAPYTEGTDVYDATATVHVGNAVEWISVIRANLSEMVRIRIGSSVGKGGAKSGYGYAWSGTGEDKSSEEAWAEAEGMAVDTWGDAGAYGPYMRGSKGMYMECYDSTEYGYSEYKNYDVGINNSESSVYQKFDIDGENFYGTTGYSSKRTGVITNVKILHKLVELPDGVLYQPSISVDGAYHVYTSLTTDGILDQKYENTWDMPDPSAIPNPECACEEWSEYTYENSQGETVTEKNSYAWTGIEMGWNVKNSIAMLYPDFTVPASWKQSNPSGCKNGRCPQGGNGNYNNSCLMVTYSLGKTVDGDGIGGMNIYGIRPSIDFATPKGLSVEFNPDISTQKELIRNPDGSPRQIKTVTELIDIQTDSQNAYKYTICRYKLEHIDLTKVNGLYPILTGHENNWTWEYTIENPDYNPAGDDPNTDDVDEGLTDYNRVIVTEVFEGGYSNAKCFVYDYDEPSSTWRLGHGYDRVASGPAWDFSSQIADKWELVQELDDSTKVVRQTLDRNFNVISRSDAIYKKLAGQYVLVSATFGEDQTQTYRNVYYDEPINDGVLYGKLRYSIDITGFWKRFEYDELGNTIKIVEQVGNRSFDSDEQQSKVAIALEDGWAVSYAGTEVSRTYQIYDLPANGFRTIRDIQCVTSGAGPDDPTNLVTTTKLYYGGDNNDKVQSITYPDGRVYTSLSSETVNGDGSTLTTSYSGIPNDPTNPISIIKGTKTETFTDTQGRTVWYKTYDIPSNILLSHTVNDEFDEFGRVLNSTDVLRGTHTNSSYGCCHLDATTDELGITTTYGYDQFDRQETVTRNGISSYTTYDLANRPLTQSRMGTDDRAVTQRTMQYDMLNRTTSSTDAAGNVTTYTYTTDPQGHQVQTATNPDGSTIVNTYNQDGTLYKSSGSATATTFYEYGTTAAPIENSPMLVYSKTIHMGDNGAMTQWEMTFTDMLGRTVCTVYSDDTPNDLTDNPMARLYYDDAIGGRLIKQVDPDGITTLYAYNADGEQDVTAIDLNGNGVIDYSIDRITKSDSMLLAAGTIDNSVPVRRSESYVWTATDLTSNDGTLTSYTESSIDGMQSWSVTLVGGSTQLVSHTQTEMQRADPQAGLDAKLTTTTTNPDGSYSVSITVNGYLQSTTSYDANDVILTQQTYAYDAHGRQYAVTDLRTAVSGSTTYTYNNADQIVAITTVDPDLTNTPGSNGPLTAQTTRFEYDKMGRQTKITLPDGTSQHRAYDLRGQLAKSWGADGYPVEYTYDTQGRRKTLTTWKDFNQSTGRGISGKAVTTWNYDPYRGNMIQKLYDDQKGTTYTYTPAGRLKTRTWARGITTTYSYDTSGQLLGVDYSDATQDIAYTYDRLGRRATTIDAAGQTVYAYVDTVNSLVTDMTVTTSASSTANAAVGTQVSYAYDSMMRRQAVTASRLVDSTMTSFTTTGYTYDAASRLKSVTDGVNFATYNYLASSGGMIDNVVYAVDTDPNDGQQLPTMTMFTTTKQYDQLGHFVSHQSVRAADSAVLSSYGYTYNQRGQRAQAQMTDGSYWDYQYDQLGQLTGAAKFTSAGKILPGYQYNYQYDQIGNRTQASSGGDPFGLNLRDTTYQSNTLNQYTQINNHPYTNVTGQAHADSTVTVQADSSQPIVGGSTTSNGTHVIQTTRTDMPGAASGGDAYFNAEIEVDRTVAGLTSHDREEVDLTVTGIRNGQGPNGEDAIDTKAITRQVPASTVTLTYDDDGNLLSDDRWTYIWNGENRLIELQPKPIYRADLAILTKRLEFTNDSQGRRIEKRVYAYNATTQQHDTLETITRFIYDGWLLIAELTKPADEQSESAGSPLRTYTNGLDLSGTPEGAGGIAGLLFTHTYDVTTHVQQSVYAYCYDGNGNVLDLLDIPTPTTITTTNAVPTSAANYEYSPFGQLIRVTGIASDSNPFLFSAKYTDKETGLSYFGFRYYDSALGRWINRDNLEEEGGISLYVYIDNVFGITDYLGMSPWSGWWKRSNNYIICMGDCIEDNDPFGLLYEKFIGFIVGQVFPKKWVAALARKLGQPKVAEAILKTMKMPGAKRITTIPSSIKLLMLRGKNSANVLRSLGAAASPFWTAYGLVLGGIELHCAAHCANNCNYNPPTGNIYRQLVNSINFGP